MTSPKNTTIQPCECSDPGCPAHKGESQCHNAAEYTMYRVDMDDQTGTPMCDDCANDAFESGLFTSDLENDIDDPATVLEEIDMREWQLGEGTNPYLLDRE